MIKTFIVSHLGQSILLFRISEVLLSYFIKSLKLFEMIESYLVIKREDIIQANLVLTGLLLKVRNVRLKRKDSIGHKMILCYSVQHFKIGNKNSDLVKNVCLWIHMCICTLYTLVQRVAQTNQSFEIPSRIRFYYMFKKFES